MLSEYHNLLVSIANTTADYRRAEGHQQTPEHVNTWIQQFEEQVRLPILFEMDYVLKQTYYSREKIKSCLKKLFKLPDSCSCWRNAEFLNCQIAGTSQHEMLSLLDELLRENCNYILSNCMSENTFVYLDDALFTGNRILKDLSKWIEESAPKQATIRIMTIISHASGQHYANQRLQECIRNTGKEITLHWFKLDLIDDKLFPENVRPIDSSGLLRPSGPLNDDFVEAYIKGMEHKPIWREGNHISIYSSNDRRELLETEFLKQGVRILNMCPNLETKKARPLGSTPLETLGFGSPAVTFRNCPNNAPLVLWVGPPWYPLFPRKTNRNYLEVF